jgi:hypothetical protein
LRQFQRLFALELDAFDFLLIEQDIFTFGIFEPFYDVLDVDPIPGTTFSYLMRLPDGSWIWLNAMVAPLLVAE